MLSRIHRVPASLPLFIPGPPYFVGTFGAIIRLRGPIMNRRALFDIGVAGPLAGFIVAVVALIIGLNLSTVVDRAATRGLQLGEPLLLQFISWLVVGSIPPQADIVLHPIGFAAWFGLFVTSLNLIPIGQLDGGHVAYALWGSRQRTWRLSCCRFSSCWDSWVGQAGGSGPSWQDYGDSDIRPCTIFTYRWVESGSLSDGSPLLCLSLPLRLFLSPSTSISMMRETGGDGLASKDAT